MLVVTSARAQDVVEPLDQEHRTPHWDPAWPHANAWDYTVASVAATAFAVEGLTLQWHQSPLRWTDPILFDQDVRSALRASDGNARQAVDLASWGLIVTQIAYPVVVDVPYAFARYGRRLAWDLFWEDAATLFLAGALDFALRDLTGRARPEVYDCISQGRTDCVDNPEAVRSFPGGHTLTATAASVLTCTQHLYVRLYGGAWDAGVCALTLASDVTVAMMRIVADSHWATDQVAALSIGALIGWGVPYLMRYRFHAKPAADKPAADKAPMALVMPMIVPVESGATFGALGMF
jgi:membrane-associated phospholipid phosphatase